MKLALVLLLISISLHAQSLSSTPTVRVKLIDEFTNKPVTITLLVPHRTADRAYWLVTSISLVATIADLENTHYCLQTLFCQEENPIYGSRRPTRLRQYVIALPIFGFSEWLMYRAKRKQDAEQAFGVKVSWDNQWKLSAAVNPVIHVFGTVFTLVNTGR